MSGSGKGLLGLWLYRSGDSEWAVKEGSPLHNQDDLVVSSQSQPQPQSNDRAKRSNDKQESPADKTSIIFTLNNQVGGLAKALQVFQELGINVLHLELQNNRSDVDQVGNREFS